MQTARKDQASLLLEAIRNISQSKQHGGTAQTTSRVQLERELQECDALLTKFVSEHYDDLGNVMSTFEQIAQRIRDSKLKILRIRDNLQNCRRLLQCKRAELRDGWIQAVEQRNIASLLDRIATVKNTLDKVDGYLAKKYYLHAAEQLAMARFQYKTELSRIEPLRPLGAELDSKLENLYQQLMDELSQQIYIRSPSSAIQLFHRHMSSRRSSSRRYQATARSSNKGLGGRRGNFGTSSVQQAQLLSRQLMAERISRDSDTPSAPKINLAALFSPVPVIPRPLHEDTTSGTNPESNQVLFLAILLESLGVLGLLRRATDAFQVNLRNELAGVVKRATQQVLDNLDDDQDDEQAKKSANSEIAAHVTASTMSAWSAFVNPLAYASQSPTLLSLSDKHRQSLKDLIELVFCQFKCVLAGHRMISELLEQARNSPAGVDAGPYSVSCVWSVMDGYLCQLVQLYANETGTDGSDAYRAEGDGGDGSSMYPDFASLVFAKDVNSSSIDIGPFFTRRKQPPPVGALFRFSNSGQAQTMDVYMREVRQQQYSGLDSSGDRRPPAGLILLDHEGSYLLSQNNWQRSLVCRPEVFNVAPLYGLIADFVGEVTEVLDPDVPKSQAIGSSSVMILMHNIIAQGFIHGLDQAVDRFLGEVPRMLDGMRLIRVPAGTDGVVGFISEMNGVPEKQTSAGMVPGVSVTSATGKKPQQTVRHCLVPFVASRMQLENMIQLIAALPDFADPLAEICERCFNCLSQHSKASYERLSRYRGVDAQQQYVSTPLTRAAIIASDQDISRVFKTNAVWYEMERSLMNDSPNGVEGELGGKGNDAQEGDVIVTHEDIASDLAREVDMIVQELRSESSSIKADALLMRLCIGGSSCRQPSTNDSLAGLARLGDSLYWFVHQLTSFVSSFNTDDGRRQSLVNVSSQLPSPASRCAKLTNVLLEIAQEMKQLADTCFLTLHLDTLLRCAAFLSTGPLDQHLGIVSGGNSDAELDALVHKVETEFSQLEAILSAHGGNAEALHMDYDGSASSGRDFPSTAGAFSSSGGGLSRSKMRYIFSGVSRLAAVLLVRYAGTRCRESSSEPFDETALNKMLRTIVALQAAFSRISGCNQADLDYARRYYELLYLTPSEVVQRIVSGGATQFSEREYDILLNLMQHSPQRKHIPPDEFKVYRDQVRDLIVAKNKIMLQQKRQQQQQQQQAAAVLQQQQQHQNQQQRPPSRSSKGTAVSEAKPATLL